MRHQLKQFLTLARMTAIETLRQPLCLLLTASCVVIMAVLPFLITHTLSEEGRLVRDSALALHFLCGLLLGSYAASASITHEIRRGTAGSVLSKPVGRWTFFLAKYAGIAAVTGLFSAGVVMATLLSARASVEPFYIDWWAGGPLLAAAPLALALAGVQNYFTRRPFASNAFALLLFALAVALVVAGFLDTEGQWTSFGSALPWPVVPASVLITLAILLLTGIAAVLATRLDTLPTLAVCSVVFIVGLMSDHVFGRHAAHSRAAALLYTVIPNWQHFWGADALTADGTIPWSYVAHAGLYASFYLAGLMALGILCFRKVEIKA